MFDKSPINLKDESCITLVKQDYLTFQIEVIKTTEDFNGYVFFLKIQNLKKDNFKIIAYSRKIYYTIQDAREAAYKYLISYTDKYTNYLNDLVSSF